MCTLTLDSDDRILRHNAAVVFDFDLEIALRQHASAELQNLLEATGGQPVIAVVADPGLEHTRLGLSEHTAAVDEAFCDVTNLGDMKVRRNLITIGQSEARQGIGVFRQN